MNLDGVIVLLLLQVMEITIQIQVTQAILEMVEIRLMIAVLELLQVQQLQEIATIMLQVQQLQETVTTIILLAILPICI